MNEKKEYGQFFTSDMIADLMVRWVVSESPKNILDPAVGPGIFLQKAEEYCPSAKKYAYDIDEKMIEIFQKENKFETNLFHQDYLKDKPNQKFQAIICNPPYNKFQEIKERKTYIEDFKTRYKINISGYSNQCTYFLIKSIHELAKNGKCCYIVPYEFLNTGYGEEIKKFLLKKKVVKAILKFDSNIKLFEDATTTSCILFIENKKHEQISFINITDLKELENFNLEEKIKSEDSCSYENSALDYKEKWLKYFKTEKKCEYHNLVLLKDIGQIKRGIATGNNSYFSLDKEKIKKYGLSNEVCMPCITKSPDIKGIFFTEDTFRELEQKNKKVYLFDGTKAKSKKDYAYIKMGEENNYHKSYLTSHRNPWYSIEKKEPAPILVSVFSRDKIKVVRNEMMIKNLTTFHGLFFKDDEIKENDINILFCYLLTPIAQKILRMNKREYGDGLDKFEPNDLNNAYVLDTSKVTNEKKKRILHLYCKLKDSKNNQDVINELNAIFEEIIKN